MNPLNEKEIIALDIETTGLDPELDGITEIAALLTVDGEIVDKYVTLVNSGKPIPYAIQRLTGIDDSMISGAPSEKDALKKLREFVGNRPILGQNIEFDIGFITTRSVKHDLPVWSGKSIDTLTAARVMYPRLTGYGLNSLVKLFGVSLENHHRAEADAKAAFEVAKSLWQKILSIDAALFDLLAVITGQSGDMKFLTWISAARESGMVGKTPPPEIDETMIALFDNVFGNPADPNECKMSEDDVLGLIGPESPLKDFVEGYTVREVQVEMAQAVLDCLKFDMSLVIEAGTGTGKSFAYLLPSIVYASGAGTKVIVSTKTKNLQEQLFFKDMPALERALPFEFRGVLLKGRGNYLCRQRFQRLIGDMSVLRFDERAALAKLLIWAAETGSGDIAEANSFYLNNFLSLWARIRSESVTCLGNRCPYRKQCFVQKVRAAAVDAQIIVVNHSLLFADIGDSVVLGEYEHAVIDEAHGLEEVAADYFGDQITTWDFTGPLSNLYRDSVSGKGFLPELYAYVSAHYDMPNEFIAAYEEAIVKADGVRQIAESLFGTISNRLDIAYDWRNAPYSLHKRFHPGEDVFEAVGREVKELTNEAARLADKIGFFLSSIPEDDTDELERLVREISGQLEKITEATKAMVHMSNPTDPDSVYWWESPRRTDSIDSKMCWAPLDVARRMHEAFHSQKRSCVFTSATMSVAGDFDYIIGRLGLDYLDPERVITMQLGSPYDFPAQLLVLFPEFLPEPNDRRFFPALSDLIVRVSEETRAGALGLFTSHKALRQVYSIITPELADHGILVLGQGLSGGRSQLTRQFIEDKESVLLGTESFWQGVDIRGEALQILFLTKLPFAVPTDPYVAGQCERIQRGGGDPCSSYTVPQAVIKFRQGIGRLIRGEEDVGVLVLCDRRVGTRAYGRAFTDSLPVEVDRVYSLLELIEKTKRFL